MTFRHAQPGNVTLDAGGFMLYLCTVDRGSTFLAAVVVDDGDVVIDSVLGLLSDSEWIVA